MNQQPQIKKRSRLIVETMEQRQESQQWEEFIAAMLSKLELPPDIRGVFGEHGVRAWKDSLPQGVLGGLLATAPTQSKSQPHAPRPSGYRNSLA